MKKFKKTATATPSRKTKGGKPFDRLAGSAYSRGILKQIRDEAMRVTGAMSVSHIYPRAYCIAKPAPLCAVFITPWMDAEIQCRREDFAASHTVHENVSGVKVGDWCALAYVSTRTCGTIWAFPLLNSAIK